MTEPVKVDNLIQSGLALHAGRLLEQYAGLTRKLPPSSRYEGTLTLSVLQMLLTNCTELHRASSSKASGRRLTSSINEFVEQFGASDYSVLHTFPDELTISGMSLLQHLRNAVSHPRAKAVENPTTGYETVKDGSGLVTTFRFTDSPDLNANGNLTKRAIDDGRTSARIWTVELSLTLLTKLTHHIADVVGRPALEAWGDADFPELLPPPGADDQPLDPR